MQQQMSANTAMLERRLVELNQQQKQANEQSQRQNAELEVTNATQALQQHAMLQELHARQQQALETLHRIHQANALNSEVQSVRAKLTTESNLNLAAQVTTVSAQVAALRDQAGAHHAEAMEEHHGTQARRVSAYS